MSSEEKNETAPKQIQMIEIARISPDSEINSRRSRIDENAKRLQASIEERGFRRELPVALYHRLVNSLAYAA